MTTTFADLGVPTPICRALERRGIAAPFPIQVATIPPALEGRDLSGKAPTGSGKTIAFGIPMVARVTRSAPKKPHGLVLTPTRELAIQVADELSALTDELRVLAVYGGAGIEPQIKKLRAGVDIIVATPGRLLDLLERNVCSLRDVTFAVVDEADRMADMGFLPDVKRILDQARDDRQTVLFSATLDGAIDELVRRYQRNPVVHELAPEPAGDITHHFWEAERPGRVALVAQVVDRLGHTVVFSRTKHGADRIARQLGNSGVKAVAIHGNRSQAQRERALEAFHRGDVGALVATDVAARGIHVEGVLGVVHFDLPADPKDYVHRSGRTGRAGQPGTVVALFDAKQRKDAEKLRKQVAPGVALGEPDVASLPEGPQQRFRPKAKGADRPASGARADRSARTDRGDRGPRAARPTGGSSEGRGRSAAGSSERPARPAGGAPSRSTGASRSAERSTSAPKGRTERDHRDREWEDRKAGGRSSSTNRAERRRGQFTPEERAARAEANERRRAASDPSAKRQGSSAGRSSDRTDAVLPDHVAGANGKVRPSGASRRKAKREQLIAAGEVPPPSKKKRSGAPRSASSNRSGAARTGSKAPARRG